MHGFHLNDEFAMYYYREKVAKFFKRGNTFEHDLTGLIKHIVRPD